MKLSKRAMPLGLAALLSFSLIPSGHAQNTLPPGTVIIPGNGGGVQVVPRTRQRRTRVPRNARGGNGPARNATTGAPQTSGNPQGQRNSRPTGPVPELIPGGVISSAPVVGKGGLIYVGSWNNKVYALDLLTGKAKWSFAAVKLINASPAVGPDGTVYAGSYDHKLYALDGQSGAKKWDFLTGDVLNAAPAAGPDGIVYVGGKDHNVYALDGATGRAKWQAKMGAAVSAPVIGGDSTVYTGADGVYALDGATGKPRWSMTTGFDPEAPVALGPDGTLYVASHSGVISALDTATGKTKWSVTLPDSIDYAPVVAGGTVYVGADKLYALSAVSGRMLWQFGEGQSAWSTPVVAGNGTVYVGCDDQSMYSLNGQTGQVNWKFNTDDPLLSFPTLGRGGLLLFSSEAQNKVYALNDRTGQVVWQFQQDPVPTPPVPTATKGRRRGG